MKIVGLVHATLQKTGSPDKLKMTARRWLSDAARVVAARVVEGRRNRRAHEPLLMIATTLFAVGRSSNGGHPFFSSSRLAVAIPRPNAWTKP